MHSSSEGYEEPIPKTRKIREVTVFRNGIRKAQIHDEIVAEGDCCLLVNGNFVWPQDFNEDLLSEKSNTIQAFTENFEEYVFVTVDGMENTVLVTVMDFVKGIWSFLLSALKGHGLQRKDVIVYFENQQIEDNDERRLLQFFVSQRRSFEVIVNITVECRIRYPSALMCCRKSVVIFAKATVKDLLKEMNLKDSKYTCKCKDTTIPENVRLYPDYYKYTIIIECFPDIDQRLQRYAELPSASNMARNTSTAIAAYIDQQKSLSACGDTICDHRNGNHNDVSIYYSGFELFVQECEKVRINEEDCKAVASFCSNMAKAYTSEKERVGAAITFFQKYIHPSFVTSPKADIQLGRACLIEVKNEEGSTDVQPFREVTRYYLDNLSPCQNPAFLVELVGPNMTIFGAVHGQYVCIDRLVPTLWLVPHLKQPSVMIHIARVLKAFKEAVNSLYSHLIGHEIMHLGNDQSTSQATCTRYPELCKFGDDQIEYDGHIVPHVFTGVLLANKKQVVIKFTETYGTIVHEFLYENGYAPKIHHVEESGRFQVVVMDKVEGLCINDYIRENVDRVEELRHQCMNILQVLNDKKYVHGDLRDVNLLVDSCHQVKVIDFEWAGVEGEAFYPFFLNHVNLEWPEGASDGQKILRKHDKYWVSKLFERD